MLTASFSLLMREESRGALASPGAAGVESLIAAAVQWVKLGVEVVGALIIAAGVVYTIYLLALEIRSPGAEGYNRIRLTLARFLALALEFQLGADILSTAVAPSWEQIGKLGAVAVIRTGLNYFLMREMEHERKTPEAAAGAAGGAERP